MIFPELPSHTLLSLLCTYFLKGWGKLPYPVAEKNQYVSNKDLTFICSLNCSSLKSALSIETVLDSPPHI